MIDPVAAMVDAATKRLNGPTGLAVAFLLLSVLVSAVTVFLQSDESKTLSRFVRFMAPIDTLTHASARVDFLFWISRKLLMPLVAVPAGASITVACSYASHAVLATAFGNARHVPDHHIVKTSLCFMVAMLLAYAPVQFGTARLGITSRQKDHMA